MVGCLRVLDGPKPTETATPDGGGDVVVVGASVVVGAAVVVGAPVVASKAAHVQDRTAGTVAGPRLHRDRRVRGRASAVDTVRLLCGIRIPVLHLRRNSPLNLRHRQMRLQQNFTVVMARPRWVMIDDDAFGYSGWVMSEGVVAVAQRRGEARYRFLVLAVRTVLQLEREVSTR